MFPPFKKTTYYKLVIVVFFILSSNPLLSIESTKTPLTIPDIITFKTVNDIVISDDGQWLAYRTQSGEGQKEAIICHIHDQVNITIPQAGKPQLTPDGRWAAVYTSSLPNDDSGIILIDTHSRKQTSLIQAESFSFTSDSQWILYRQSNSPQDSTTNSVNLSSLTSQEKEIHKRWLANSFTLVIRNLQTTQEYPISHVIYYAVDPTSRYIAFNLYTPDGKENGLYCIDLSSPSPAPQKIITDPFSLYTNITWSPINSRLAFIFHRHPPKENITQSPLSSGVKVWDSQNNQLRGIYPEQKIPKGWMLPAENRFKWSEDAERLFFGIKPYDEYARTLRLPPGLAPDASQEYDGVTVWHWKDERLQSQQQKLQSRLQKQIYYVVYHFSNNTVIPLASPQLPRLEIPINPNVVLAFSEEPDLKERSWENPCRDVYLVNLNSGTQELLIRKQREKDTVSLSPNGNFVAYYRDGKWFLYNVKEKRTHILETDTTVSFADNQFDFPGEAPPCGLAGWTQNDESLLIYDNNDIWDFPTQPSSQLFSGICRTKGQGKRDQLVFRIPSTELSRTAFQKGQTILLSAYSLDKKYTALYRTIIGQSHVEPVLIEQKTIKLLKKSLSGIYYFSKEDYREFPDISVTEDQFKTTRRITHINPQQDKFLWGNARLIEWEIQDKTKLQGLLILPDDYDSSRRYPVLVYCYDRFTSQLYQYPFVGIGTFPTLPYYSGAQYVLFLPDIRFRIGEPGESAYESIMPGVEKLIKNGIADPQSIAIFGHSWGGYLVSYLITRTALFKAAIAGAPVSDLSSAYNSVRWENGISRQYQYEKSQGRMGKSLWEAPESYIHNSPIFSAHKIQTPLLIEFGDNDAIVPWNQGIELYLAMRRLGKPCILLQYKNESHHLKKIENKHDYFKKIKEYLDYYLKGVNAPSWIQFGSSPR